MKRSKFFLAGTSFLLAIVGVAAAKAHRNTAVTGFYKNGGNCNLASQTKGFTVNHKTTSVLKHTTGGVSGNFTLYSKSSNTPSCIGSPLYTVGS